MLFAAVEIDDVTGDIHIGFEHPDESKRKSAMITDAAGKYLFMSGNSPGHIVLELDKTSGSWA